MRACVRVRKRACMCASSIKEGVCVCVCFSKEETLEFPEIIYNWIEKKKKRALYLGCFGGGQGR